VKILICSFYFPPTGGGGVQRPLKFAELLPEFGIEAHVLAPGNAKWLHHDEPPPALASRNVHRAPFLGPRGRLPAEELYGRRGGDRLLRKLLLTPRRFLLPDEDVTWLLTALPVVTRIVHRERIDVLLTTSPPTSVHLTGALAKRLTGIPWVADVRDSIVANHDRRLERRAVRAKEQTHRSVARLVAKRADAVVAVTGQIAAEMRAIERSTPVAVIPNGADFDDFADLSYQRGERFRITHTGSFFGQRDPRPFLTALARLGPEVLARFVGDFRRSDLDWVRANGLEHRLELLPYSPRQRSLERQRASDALLLLLPEVGQRGQDVPSGKLFEYLAARRPILAAVPPAGTAAQLIREAGAGIVVAPDDVDGIQHALEELVHQWRADQLTDVSLAPGLVERISRRTRARELADVLQSVTKHRSNSPMQVR
jgi:glycosyltransferase involved in cell wall biosynthesis